MKSSSSSSSLSAGGLLSILRIRGKLKFILVLLFAFSLLFLSYQLIYYTNLTNYQSQENQRNINNNKHKPIASSGGYRSLKDIAYHLEEDKHKNHKGHQELPIPPKGDTGPVDTAAAAADLVEPPPPPKIRRGKPIFSEHVLGVAAEAQKFYMIQQQKHRDFFSCFTSGKKITWDKVNDDFCDCPTDGSDEPSTAACMNGRFFCSANKKGYPGM